MRITGCTPKHEGVHVLVPTHVARFVRVVSLSMRLESQVLESGMSLVGGQSRTRASRRETNRLTTNASDNHTGLDWLNLNAAPAGIGEEDWWTQKQP